MSGFLSILWPRRRVVIGAVSVALSLALYAASALAVDGYLVTVTGNPGQVMDGAKVLARVPRGTRLWVLEEKEGWLHVNDPKSDQRGWISDKAVQEVTFTDAQQKQLEQAAKHYSDYEEQLEKEQFREARQNLEATLRIERQVYGSHPDIAVTLGDLCLLLGKLGEHAAAQQAGEEALAFRRQLLGSKHVETALMAGQLGEQLLEAGNHLAARKLLDEALPVLRAEAPESADTALVINALGNVELALAKHAEARIHYDEALAILRKSNEDQSDSIATVTNNLGLLAHELGDYSGARKHLEEALVLTRKIYGEEHSEVTLLLNNLGMVADSQGDLPAARRLYEEALRIMRKVYGDMNYNTAMTLSNLGLILFQQGDFAAARRHNDEALAIFRVTYKTPHSNTAMVLVNLGYIAGEQKSFAEARKFLDEALSISRVANGPEHNYTAAVLDAQAQLAVREGDFPRAQKLFEEALAICRKTLGEQHPETATVLNALAQLALKRGDYAAAWKILDGNLSLAQRLFGKDHPITATVLADLAKLAVLEGDVDEAQRRWDDVRRVERRHTQYLLSSLSPLEQLKYLEHQYQPRWFQCLSFGFDHRAQSAAANMSATWLINGKAIAQEALAERELIARDLSNPKLAPLVRELQQVRQRLASLSLSSPKAGEAAAHQAKILELGNEEYRLAQALAQENGRETISRKWIELTALRRSLSPEAIYLDLVRMPLHDFKTDKDSPPHYLVWIVPPHARGSVQIIDLGLAEPIDTAVEQMREVVAKAATQVGEQGEAASAAAANTALGKLAELILTPLLPHLGDAKQLLLSPDGTLWLVPWAALPARDKQPLLTQQSIRLVLSGRDLVKDQTKPALAAEAPVIVVDPNYDLQGKAAKKVVRTLLPMNEEQPETTRGVTSASSLPQVAALPFTALEGQITRPLVEKLAGQEAKLFEQDAALETIVKKSARPRLLYIATHGFFLPDQEAEHRDELTLGNAKTPALTKDSKPIENPLLRCGLMFAGCNAERTAGLDDGVLTGLEIVGMDLRGTELVVLSACETGVGKVRNGEGVAGLRQAFQLAGAQSVVSTLWQVPDRDSALIMQDFFTNLAAGQSKADALRAAQLKRITARKEKSGAAHPFFWAAWTVTGD